LLAFAAVAQFAPGIFAALYWSGASRGGVFWGMLIGFVTWSCLLFLPNLVAGGLLAPAFGPLRALGLLLPHALTDYSALGTVGPRALIALTLNISVMLIVSARRGVTLQERFAARAFIAPKRPAAGLHAITSNVADLESVAARIIGSAAARQALHEYAAQAGTALPKPTDAAHRDLLQYFERVLAGSIGASSARVVLTHALKRKGLSLDEVAEMLDETSQELLFSRQLLQAAMENVTQGISVVDAEMRIVAWNRRYLELVGFPEGMVYVGRPVADLIRYNAELGELGPGDPEAHVEKRLAHMRAGTAYNFQRTRRSGRVYSIHGQPMSGGGYVATYTDITEYKLAEQALLEAKQGLEERVAQRTNELSQALEAQPDPLRCRRQP
jgi:PAS domain S-box-containing protein